MKHGDKNSKFFHFKASQRRRRNFIQGIRDLENNWVEEQEDIADVATNYFGDLFSAGVCDQIGECLNAVSHKVTDDMRQTLSNEFTADEIKEALFQMGPTKAPGPDGMNALFYQKFWHIVGDNVISAVLDFFNSGVLEPEINHTNIVLIPKVMAPEKMLDFRPISLCNVIYKIISKVLANRLKQVLPHIISSTQSAFVPSRLITDNVLVACETLHSMRGRRKGKTGLLALKLDISKAYDRVEWAFLKGIMVKLGFPDNWINWVMTCVSTPTFSVLINGKPFGHITPSRGLRQGDPLSPYLFLLCAEGFSSLLFQAEVEGRLHGVSICKRAPRISHLLFADDSLLFCQATQKEVNEVNGVLQTYASASGQCINLEKSSVLFSSNTLETQKEWTKATLGVKEVEYFESYLGLPTFIGRAKYQTFAFIKDRVWKKLQGWKGKLLSRAGKEVLIKAVAQSIPTYTMGVFQLPVKLCNELSAMCARFWWGQVENERKIHWKSWGVLSQAKKDGGMGFRDLRAFNLALLAKQGWRLMQSHDSLLYQCFKYRYFPRCNFLEASDSPNSSFVWKSLMAAMPILKQGCCWRVGDGSSIRVMEDRWIINYPTNKVLHPPEEQDWEWRVSDLIDQTSRSWDRELVWSKFHRDDAEAICRIPLSHRNVLDSLLWLHTKDGRYSVRSGYYLARQILRSVIGLNVPQGVVAVMCRRSCGS